ncbi:hypothetical protein M422DRAFT_222953 [Sphaerobolus stellatus SS14]|nr:hypothetical protein M422DRAFT_222953 [Sphaerobolus stellatus SS14]
MSLGTFAYISRSQYFVAIAGATGKLGTQIAKVFLSQQYRSFFTQVFLLVRNPDSAVAKELEGLGGELIQADFSQSFRPEDLTQTLRSKGVNVLVNALGTWDHDAKENLLKVVLGLITDNLLLYIPSEFGVDYRFNDFTHVMWDSKREHIAKVRDAGKGKVKVVAIYAAIFLEQGIVPWYGFNMEQKQITVFGSPDTQFSFTSTSDIAKSVAQIALQALSNPSEFPDDVRIAGSTASWKHIREVFAKESGEDISLSVGQSDLQSFRKELDEKYQGKGPAIDYIRLLMAQGKLDFSKDNYNERLNPAENLWKWKTLEEYAKETKGRPPAPNV